MVGASGLRTALLGESLCGIATLLTMRDVSGLPEGTEGALGASGPLPKGLRPQRGASATKDRGGTGGRGQEDSGAAHGKRPNRKQPKLRGEADDTERGF